MVVIDPANNLAISAKTAVGLKSVGVAQSYTENNGADGDVRVRVSVVLKTFSGWLIRVVVT